MKNRKLFRLLSLVLALSFTFVACGVQNNDTAGGKETINESKTEDNANTDVKNKETSDDDKDDVKESNEDQNDDKDDINESDDDKDDSTATNVGNGSKGIETKTFEIDFDKAISIFQEHFNNSTINIKSIDFDEDSGAYEYEIEGWKDNTEFKLTVDATSGKVSEEEKDNDNDDKEKLDLSNIIKPNEAMEIALKNSNGGFVKDWELSFDDDKNVYEINIENGDDIDIDALTKEVLERD